MRNLFSKRRYGPIGLDIGAEGIRMLQLDRSGGRSSLAAAARWHWPEGASADDPAERHRLAGEAVRKLLRDGGFHGREVISCLRVADMSVKNVRLPHMPDRELASAVQWECQERFGFAVSPDRVHYIRAGEVRQGNETRDEVLLMAVPEQAVQEHLDLLSAMHVRPVHIDSEPTALFRAYRRFLRRAADESSVTVIVDVGLASTKVIVAGGQTIVLVKCVDVAGQTLNESVAKELNLSYGEARHLRRTAFAGKSFQTDPKPSSFSDKVEWSVFDAVRGHAEALTREIALCLRYCSVTFRGLRPARITLTGGEAYDLALVKLLGDGLDCECAVGEPLRGIELGEADLGSDRRGVLTEWSVATGLALRGAPPRRRIGKADDERSRIPA